MYLGYNERPACAQYHICVGFHKLEPPKITENRIGLSPEKLYGGTTAVSLFTAIFYLEYLVQFW